MGSVAIPPEKTFDQPGMVDEALEKVAQAGAAIGTPLKNIAKRYTEDTSHAAQDAMRLAVESGQNVGQALRENRPADAVGQATWQVLGNLGVPFAPLTGAAKTAGHYASYLTGNPGFGERVEFLGGFADPSHVGMIKAMAPLAGVSRPAVQTAKEVMTAQRELSPLGLYSHGAETAIGLPQAKGSPEQIAGMLKNQGVKPAELEGFTEAFAGRPSITREEAAEYFKGRMPEVEDRVFGGDYQAKMDALKKQKSDLSKEWQALEDGDPRREELVEKMSMIFGEINDLKQNFSAPKFQDYALPGGENYREVLLKLKDNSEARIKALEEEGQQLYKNNRGSSTEWPEDQKTRLQEILEEQNSLREQQRFYSKHWNDPDVLAHIRMSDRIGPNGERILHVEEMQSDWAQKAQKIRNNEIKRIMREKNLKKEEAAKLVPPEYGFEGDTNRYNELLQKFNETKEAFSSYKPDPEYASKLQSAYDKAMADYNAYYETLTDEKFRKEFNRMHLANKGVPMPEETINDLLEIYKFKKGELAKGLFPHEFEPLDQARQKATFDLNELRNNDPIKEELRRKMFDAENELFDFADRREILPQNPYVENTSAWTDLALKRILKEAAEGGYDKVVWTPGAAHAKRYDLRKQVKQIIAENREDGIALNVYDHNDNKIIQPRGLTMDEVAEHIGKDAAEKIAAQFEASKQAGHNTQRADLRGLDLKVGGEGMVGYYDKIVPTQLQKLLKKLDRNAKIERHAIPNSGKVTGASGADVMDELPATRTMSSQERADFWRNLTSDERNALLEDFFEKQKQDIVGHGITMTPQMREAILRGFSHFAHGGEVDKYPLRDHTDWEEAHDYEKSGGELHYNSPEDYLDEVKPLNMDHEDKDIIHHFKKQIKHGEKLDPVAIYPDGHPNGRHRAHAAKKLGIKKIPVVSWPHKKEGGSIVDRALMLTSRKA
jgi:hypothetical protein